MQNDGLLSLHQNQFIILWSKSYHSHIQIWFSLNFLKQTGNKTEILLI